MRLLVRTILILVFSVAAYAEDKTGVAEFSAPKDKVYAAAMIVVSRDAIRIDQANQESGFISYTKWFSKAFNAKSEISITLLAIDDGKRTKVLVVTGNGGVKKKTIHAIAEELVNEGLIPKNEIPAK